MTLIEEIRLAAGPGDLDNLVSLARAHAAEMAALQAQAATEAATSQASRNDFGTPFGTIVRNNADTDPRTLLSRPDVQARLTAITQRVERSGTSAVTAGYELGHKLGTGQIRAEAKALGLSLPSRANAVSSSFQQRLLEDVQRNTSAHHANTIVAAVSGFSAHTQPDPNAVNLPKNLAAKRAGAVRIAADREARRLDQRLRASASVAVQRGVNEARIQTIRDLQEANPDIVVSKLWITSFGPNTCGTCASLHGTVLSVDEEFNHAQTFVAGTPPRVYQDLQVPPRHPFCHCVVSLHVESLGSTASMRESARQFAETAEGMAPQSWTSGTVSSVAHVSEHMAASDFRVASDAQFEHSLATFRACLLRS